MKKIKFPKILQNSLVGIIASVISTLSIYIVRIVISKVLGEEIYGVNSIFISVVNAFLILELGMSTAMIISMYQPVADENRAAIKSILGFYKKFYRIFCLILVVLGVIVDVFLLRSFVKTNLDFGNVQLYFILYLFSIVFKYLWSYKNCLLYANKQNSVISLSTIFVTIIFTAIEIFSIIYLKDYRIYLILFLLQNITLNAACNVYANKKYPYIKEKDVAPLDSKSKRQLVKIIRPMFIQRLANQLQDASSVIILGFLGTSAAVVGYFSNYVWVVHACQTIFTQIGTAFTTSFGNFYAKNNDSQKNYSYYEKARFYMSWIAVVFSVLYLCLIQTFVGIFFGTEYCMTNSIAVVFSVYVFVLLNSSVNLSIQNAVGAHYLDTAFMVVQTIIGFVLSVLLGMWLGAIGVILGLLMPIIIFTGIIKGSKIYQHVFFVNYKKHILTFIRESLTFVLVAISSYLIYTKILTPNGLLGFVLSAVAIFVISNVEIFLLNIKSKHIIEIKEKIRKKVSGGSK